MVRITANEFLEQVQKVQAPETYSRVKAECSHQVVTWRWATDIMLSRDPNEALVEGVSLQWCEEKPEFGLLHGLDDQQRVRMMRTEELDNDCFEVFLVANPGGVWRYSYSERDRNVPCEVIWTEFEGDRWLSSLKMGESRSQLTETRLEWEAGRPLRRVKRTAENIRLDALESVLKGEIGIEFGAPTILEYLYGEDGLLNQAIEMTYVSSGDLLWSIIKYQRLRGGVTLQTLLADVEEILVREIPVAVQKRNVCEPVYAMILGCTGVDTDVTGYPPPLTLPTVAYRNRNHPSDVFALCEMQNRDGVYEVACQHTELEEKLQIIFLLTIGGPNHDYSPVREMFQRVCARLNTMNWSEILPATDDFVVFLGDDHGEMSLNESLLACVPREKFDRLIQSEYIEE